MELTYRKVRADDALGRRKAQIDGWVEIGPLATNPDVIRYAKPIAERVPEGVVITPEAVRSAVVATGVSRDGVRLRPSAVGGASEREPGESGPVLRQPVVWAMGFVIALLLVLLIVALLD